MSAEGVVSVISAVNTILPNILGLIVSHHAEQNPDAAPLTEAQALAGLQAAIAASLAIDAQLRASAGHADVSHEGPTFGGSTGE